MTYDDGFPVTFDKILCYLEDLQRLYYIDADHANIPPMLLRRHNEEIAYLILDVRDGNFEAFEHD